MFFSVSSAVLQRCHNRGWTSLSSLCLLSRQLTMEHSAGGDPDPLIVLWQPWPSQREDRKQQNTACWPAHPPPPPLPNYIPYTSTIHSPQHPIITPIHSDAIPVTKDIFFLHNNVINAIWILVLLGWILATALSCFHFTVLLINNSWLGFYFMLYKDLWKTLYKTNNIKQIFLFLLTLTLVCLG